MMNWEKMEGRCSGYFRILSQDVPDENYENFS
jgi:hypothetical protein